MKTYRIGIDVGGTNTDAVLIDAAFNVIAKTKTPTTGDVNTGITKALREIIDESKVSTESISDIMLGTTQCTNAIVERKNLAKVGVIRLAAPAGMGIPICEDWPADLKKTVVYQGVIEDGGFEFNGKLINQLNEERLKEIVSRWVKTKEVDAIAISGVFSCIDPSQEIRAMEIIRPIVGDNFFISLSHKIAGMGILERENSNILNASLYLVAANMTTSFQKAVNHLNIKAKLFITQNDGSLCTLAQVNQFPVFTMACGPTNSIRGAAKLTGIKNAITIDVGGTTSDGGVLQNNFPRESNLGKKVGGVITNFRMPDVVSIGVGGGTIVKLVNNQVIVGPESVGYNLLVKALSFGGHVPTLTDFALLSGRITIPKSISQLEIKNKIEQHFGKSAEDILTRVNQIVKSMIDELIDSLKTVADPMPLILVGGGAAILGNKFEGISDFISHPNADVANAFGAAIGYISGEYDQIVVSANNSEKEKALADAVHEAKLRAVENGANETTLDVVMQEVLPVAYLPNAFRIKVKVCGDFINNS